MIPIRQNNVQIVDRIRKIPLGIPTTVTLTMDEEWSPRIQGEITLDDHILAERLRPGDDQKLGSLQADIIRLEIETTHRPHIGALVTAFNKLPTSGGTYGGSVAIWSVYLNAYGPTLAGLTQADEQFSATTGGGAWNQGEVIEPLRTATALWGGVVEQVTEAFGPVVQLAKITAALRTPGGVYDPPPTDRLSVQLRIRGEHPNWGDGTTTLTVASEEVRLEDYRRTITTTHITTETSLRALVRWVLSEILKTAAIGTVLELAPGPDIAIPAGQEWTTGQTASEMLHPIIEAVGWTLYCDVDARYYLEPRTTTVAPLDLDIDRNILDIENDDEVTGDWYDGAVIEYTDADPLDPAARFDIYAPWAQRVAHLTRPGVRPVPGAAQQFVERARSRGVTGRIESLMLTALRPAQRVTSLLDTYVAQGNVYRLSQSGTIRTVTHRLPDGETSLTLRDII